LQENLRRLLSHDRWAKPFQVGELADAGDRLFFEGVPARTTAISTSANGVFWVPVFNDPKDRSH